MPWTDLILVQSTTISACVWRRADTHHVRLSRFEHGHVVLVDAVNRDTEVVGERGRVLGDDIRCPNEGAVVESIVR
jgi:hypothetical protein